MDQELCNALLGLCRALSKALATATRLDEVLGLLQATASVFFEGLNETNSSLNSSILNEEVLQSLQRVQRATSGLGDLKLIKDFFYGIPFQELGEVLLSAVAPDWRFSFSKEQDESLFMMFFQEAPLDAALLVCTTHLSTVEAVDELSRGRTVLTAVSAEVACEILSRRLAGSGSTDLRQLFNTAALPPSHDSASASARDSQQRHLHAVPGPEAVASALASLPERAAACDSPALYPATFAPLLAKELLAWLQQLQHSMACCQAPSPAVHSAVPPTAGTESAQAWEGALAFAADLLSRLSRRGHAQHVAGGLWSAMQEAGIAPLHSHSGRPPITSEGQNHPPNPLTGTKAAAEPSLSAKVDAAQTPGNGREAAVHALHDVISALVAHMDDAPALEKLVEAFLRVLAEQRSTEAQGQSVGKKSCQTSQGGGGEVGSHPECGTSPQGSTAGLSDEVAVRALCTLCPYAMWRIRPDLRYTLTYKLLTQRVLPAAAMRWIVQYVDCMAAAASPEADVADIVKEGRTEGGQPLGDSEAGPREKGLPGRSEGTNPRSTGRTEGSAAQGGGVAELACQLARVWGDPALIRRLPLPQQAYITAALVESLSRVGGGQLEGHPGLLPAVLSGVGARLESPMQVIRRQAMRVGYCMSVLLDPAKPLFLEDKPWELLPEERWERQARKNEEGPAPNPSKRGMPASHHPGGQNLEGRGSGGQGLRGATLRTHARTAGTAGNREDAEGPLTETDSDDELAADVEGEDLEPYSLDESDEDDVEGAGLQLRDLTSMLRNGEKDWKGQLKALRCAEALIRAAPDELEHYSVPLARALLHAQLPKWFAEESKEGEEPPEMLRFRCLVASVTETPLRAGTALASEFYSPSLDMHHRDVVLTTLSTAAQELAHPGSFLQPLPEAAVPSSKGLTAGKGRGVPAERGGPQGREGSLKVKGSVGRVTRVSERALAARKGQAGRQEFVNRFSSVALAWGAALLKDCDKQLQGSDLFGRDHFLLGRLLVTLGTLVECCGPSPQALPLAAGVLELIHSRRVHDSQESYVRRAALLAASQVLVSLPPARLSSAMLAAASSADCQDAALVSRLDWVRQWAESTAESDTDDGCRKMASSCRQLQASLAAGALAALESDADSLGLDSTSGLGGSSYRECLPMPRPGIQITAPSLEQLRLK